MQKLWAGVAIGLVAVGSWAAPAVGKTYGPKSPEMAACLIGAATWDGTGSTIVEQLVVSTKPFPQLTRASDMSLRKAVHGVVTNPADDVATRAFGRWCKNHFPKVSAVAGSAYLPVPATTATTRPTGTASSADVATWCLHVHDAYSRWASNSITAADTILLVTEEASLSPSNAAGQNLLNQVLSSAPDVQASMGLILVPGMNDKCDELGL